MNIWRTQFSNMPGQNRLKKPSLWFKAFSFGHLSSQSPIFTPLLSSYSRLCWMRRMLFAGLSFEWAWHRNNYLSLWSITWLLTRDAQDVRGAEPGLQLGTGLVQTHKHRQMWTLHAYNLHVDISLFKAHRIHRCKRSPSRCVLPAQPTVKDTLTGGPLNARGNH